MQNSETLHGVEQPPRELQDQGKFNMRAGGEREGSRTKLLKVGCE